jgi:iron-sulfur cluster repair protein YtfE (RIC family)
MSESPPSEVLARVLKDHRELQVILHRLEILSRSVLQGHASVLDELRAQGRELDQRLREHLELEEEILIPALLDTDSFGTARAERMREEHERQREIMALAWLAGPEDRRSPYELALISWGIVRLLREDMAEEERVSLNRKVLHDFPTPEVEPG